MPARLALVCAALLAGCAPAPGASSPSDEAPAVSLTVEDAGRPVVLAIGQRVVVSLEANRTTGYGWSVADAAGGALVQEGEATYLEDPPRVGEVGVGGMEEVTLRAARAGTGTLLLVYRRPSEADVAPAEAFSAPVTVH